MAKEKFNKKPATPTTVVPEEDKVSSVADVVDRASNDTRLDDTPVQEITETEPAVNPEPQTDTEPTVNELDTVSTEPTPEEKSDETDTKPAEEESAVEVEVNVSGVVNSIIKDDKYSLLEKIERISKVVPADASKIIVSLLSIFNNCSKVKTRVAAALNPEQKQLVRNFIKLASLQQEEFNESMKYINWVYKQLTDITVMQKERLVLVRGVSPLDPLISSAFIVNKDDAELITYVYLMAVIDFRANAKTEAEKAKRPNMQRSTADTLLTEDILNKINGFYDK